MGAVGRTRKISDSDWLPLSFPWVTISTTGRDPSHFITQVTGCPNRWAEVEKIGPVLSTLAQIGHFKALPVDQELVRATAARASGPLKNSESVASGDNAVQLKWAKMKCRRQLKEKGRLRRNRTLQETNPIFFHPNSLSFLLTALSTRDS